MMPELTFGKRLRILLQLLKISQRDFAKEINISESQLSKLLNNKKKPTSREIFAILDALDISYECMFGKMSLFDTLLLKCYDYERDCLW